MENDKKFTVNESLEKSFEIIDKGLVNVKRKAGAIYLTDLYIKAYLSLSEEAGQSYLNSLKTLVSLMIEDELRKATDNTESEV